MASFDEWVAGARPRTLPAAVSPVLLGTAAADALDKAHLGHAVLALVVALALQVGVNYANDYSDGVRGTDDVRVGPVRLVGQRLAAPRTVLAAAILSLVVAAVAGLLLVWLTQAWFLLGFGALAILAAWLYTGGPRPYGYAGLGEVSVFAFFGLFATLGTQYTQAGRVSWVGILGAVGVGAIATAILVANNLRDIPSDTVSGKRTLAVQLGDRRTRLIYLGLLGLSVLCVVGIAAFHPPAVIGLGALLVVWRSALSVWGPAAGRDLVPVLVRTGVYEAAWAVAVAIGVLLDS